MYNDNWSDYEEMMMEKHRQGFTAASFEEINKKQGDEAISSKQGIALGEKALPTQ